MIDDFEKTVRLMEQLKKALPIRTRITPYLAGALAVQEPGISMPEQCNVIEVIYTGDMGGILCRLDVGVDGKNNPIIVSITHLAFGQTVPLSREIAAYQKRRTKKLKRQNGK